PHLSPPPRAGEGVTGVEAAGQALLLPPHAGEGRGGAVSDARTCGAAVGPCPHPGPPPLAGEGVSRAWRRLGRPCSFPRMRGKAGMGAASDARTCGAAVGLCPHPNPPPRTGEGGHGRGGGWAALLLPPHAGEGRDGGQRPTRGSATKQQHLAASAFHLATTPVVRC